MRARRLKGVLAVAAPCLTAACASAPAGSPTDACVFDLASDARSLTDHVDSAAFALELERWGPATGLTVARITPDSVGAASAWVVSEALDSTGTNRLEEMLERHTRVVPTRGDPVLLEVGTWLALGPRRVRELEPCRPALRDPQAVRRGLRQEAQRLDLEGGQWSVRVWAFVGGDGTVREARVNEASGHLDVDRAAVRVVQGALFSPASLAGIPISVWVELPINLDVEEPPPPRDPLPPGFPPDFGRPPPG